MESSSGYLDAAVALLPPQLATQINDLIASRTANEPHQNSRNTLENLFRFFLGVEAETRQEGWSMYQSRFRDNYGITMSALPSVGPNKRARLDDDGDDTTTPAIPPPPKKQRMSPPTLADSQSDGHIPKSNDGPPIFTIQNTSITSPLRKKVDITIYPHAIILAHPASKATEASIPLHEIKRAFILPLTRGRTKPRWTLVLMGRDVVSPPVNTKQNGGKSTPPEGGGGDQQLILTLDFQSPTEICTIVHPSQPTKHPKGTPTLPLIRLFLTHLSQTQTSMPITIHEPSPEVFKSAFASGSDTSGTPSVEAYKAAKQGNLYFMPEGVLWGESKPCEFWDVRDLVRSTGEGVRVIGGGGRTCAVLLRRRKGDGEADEEDEEADETEFGMIDAKEQDRIQGWVRTHQRFFGNPSPSPSANGIANDKGKGKATSVQQPAGPVTIRNLMDNSDDEDDDFVGSESENSDAESGSESGSDSDADAEGDDDEEDDDDDEQIAEDENAPLDPSKHPLLRSSTRVRLSKAVVDMVVDMCEEDLLTLGAPKSEEDEDEAQDELED